MKEQQIQDQKKTQYKMCKKKSSKTFKPYAFCFAENFFYDPLNVFPKPMELSVLG